MILVKKYENKKKNTCGDIGHVRTNVVCSIFPEFAQIVQFNLRNGRN